MRRFSIAYLLISAFLLRIIFSGYFTLDLDFNTFLAWSNAVKENGFNQFYSNWSDYLPGYIYVLYILKSISLSLPFLPEVLLYKLPAIISDVITTYLIWKIVEKLSNKDKALIAAAVYAFNPAIFINSTLWGQIDSLTALFSLLGIYFLPTQVLLSGVFFGIGALIKPQIVFAAPAVLYLLYKKELNSKNFLITGLVSFLVFMAGFLIFLPESASLLPFIFERVGVTLGQYPYTSLNAFNFWGIFGLWLPDSDLGIFSPKYIGYLAYVIFLLLLTKSINKNFLKGSRVYLMLATSFIVSFLFFTRFHERHLLPALAPLAISAGLNYSLMPIYLGYSMTHIINMIYSYVWIQDEFKSVLNPFSISLISILNVAMLLGFLKIKLKKIKIKLPENYLLVIILIFSLTSRLINLHNPGHEYFDEVYHAFTAREILHGSPKAWEWWNDPPEGFAYEWTHPPFAKLAMVGSMYVLGENSFAWRFPAAVFGTLSVYLVYLLAKEILKEEKIALLSAAIFSLDGLVLVMSRIGMNDIYLITFILLSLLFFLRNKYFASSIFLGLAASSKWSAIWFLPVLLAAFWVFRRKFTFRLLYFALIPPIIYGGSYLPMFLTGHGWDIFIGVQKQMYWYHTRLDATHPFTSPWWSWPLLLRPIWLYTNSTKNMISNIYASGNPFVFWLGFISILYATYSSLFKKHKELGFIVFSYVIFFVPWALSPRIMFLYHYLPSIPFLCIAIAYLLSKFPRMVIPAFCFIFASFLYFYPHWTGIGVPVWLDGSYYWLVSWK